MLDIQKLREILAKTNKFFTPQELEVLKSWFETNEGLMDFKSKNNNVDSKDYDEKSSDFHMDIFDVIRDNDPNYRN